MIVEEFKSKYSGKLTVKKIWDWGWQYYVTTGVLSQSGGIINDLWKPIIFNIQCLMSNVLILGLATGTAARIINKKFKNVRITGVEIDPVMIKIGKKYFDLDKIPNLKIINIDASKYCPKEIYELILVDLYVGDKCPKFVYTKSFLEKVRRLGKIAIFNHLFYDAQKKEDAEKLIKKLGKYYKNIKLQRVLTNVMIICE
ncbi:hypothetical protein HZB69_01280 [Candidatus Amesbacteria bacterium]|nr:hypothetical protein [Candidatus Amesbacteria bacterium]